MYDVIYRSGGVTERFTERMSSIEKKKSERHKSKFAPIGTALGKFSTAFRKFELNGGRERSHSIDALVPSDNDSVPASRNPSRASSHSMPRGFGGRGRAKEPHTDENKAGETKGLKKSPTRNQAARAVSMPLESSRLIRPLRESTNAPDVVPARKDKDKTERVTQFDAETRALKFDRVSRQRHHYWLLVAS